MRSGTVLALIVSFALGIGCTISVIAWFNVASTNVALNLELAGTKALLGDAERANERLAQELAAAQTQNEGLQAMRTRDARETKVQTDTLKGEIRSLNERLQSALKDTQRAVDHAVAAERRSLDRKDQQLAQIEDELEDVRSELRQLLATEGVSAAVESAKAKAARESRLDAEKERLIPFRIYARTVTSESPAGKRYTETEQLVAFDTNRDGKFDNRDEIWMQGRRAYEYAGHRLNGFTLKREGECLPERMNEIGN